MTGAFLGLSVSLVVKYVAGLGLGAAVRSCSRVVAVGWLTLLFVVGFVLSFGGFWSRLPSVRLLRLGVGFCWGEVERGWGCDVEGKGCVQ